VLNISLKTFFYTLRHQAQVIYPASNVKTLCNRRVLTQKEAFCGKFLNDGRIFLLFYRRLLKAMWRIGKTYIGTHWQVEPAARLESMLHTQEIFSDLYPFFTRRPLHD